MNDLISRQAAIDAIRASASKYTGFMEMEMYTDDDAVEAINGVPSAQQWIPVKTRPITEDERKYYEEIYSWTLSDDEAVIFDCKMWAASRLPSERGGRLFFGKRRHSRNISERRERTDRGKNGRKKVFGVCKRDGG